MSQEARISGATWAALLPAGRGVHRPSEVGAPGSRRRARSSRPAAYAVSTPAQAIDTSKQGRLSPRVFAGLVRMAEFGLVSGIGFLIAYFYVADLFRQYAAALALAGFAAVTVFQTLGLYNMGALAAAHRQMPRLLMGWTATVGLLLAGLFFLKIAPDF